MGGEGPTVPLVVDVAHTERRAIDSQIRSDVRNLPRRPRGARRIALLLADRATRISAERRAFRSSTLLTACSAVEAAAARRDAGGEVAVVPNGVDLPEQTHRATGTQEILFVGNLGYPPNVEALNRLATRILPDLRASHPRTHLTVIGPGSSAVTELADCPGVRIAGFVPDIKDAYSSAALMVAPIFAGSGTKTKVLEAMAYGVPVVTTGEGVAGLAITPGEHALIGNSDRELVQHARQLLNDPKQAQTIANAARSWVEADHGWPTIGRDFNERLLVLARRAAFT
ncbi:MAG: glycosyltransferase family 4 protein [Microthrixaceae bacterium]|nr:glycosyltransferase family 4 protein [Microthrixaceae bacterium]